MKEHEKSAFIRICVINELNPRRLRTMLTWKSMRSFFEVYHNRDHNKEYRTRTIMQGNNTSRLNESSAFHVSCCFVSFHIQKFRVTCLYPVIHLYLALKKHKNIFINYLFLICCWIAYILGQLLHIFVFWELFHEPRFGSNTKPCRAMLEVWAILFLFRVF